ncbi:MAG: hypothetical protein L0229_26085 [Blastocatellia bacterium]|nr:hypothetical protein [Blastocatellia bacterium]
MENDQPRDIVKRQSEKEGRSKTSGEGESAGSEGAEGKTARNETTGPLSGNAIAHKEMLSPGIESGSGSYMKTSHPSRNLETRAQGYGMGGGYERSYGGDGPKAWAREEGLYGALSHGGYYGAGTSARRFKVGQAGFREELMWYGKQYGDKTSKYGDEK